MPELKNTFLKGRMNRDLDERLVPSGEYRLAENIEILTSETSGVGTVQVCRGNEQESNIAPVDNIRNINSTCVGSIVDEKDNAVYWFIAGPRFPTSAGFNGFINIGTGATFTLETPVLQTANSTTPYKDMIVQFKDDVTTPVWVDVPIVAIEAAIMPLDASQLAGTTPVPMEMSLTGTGWNIQAGMTVVGVDTSSQTTLDAGNAIASNIIVAEVEIISGNTKITFNESFNSNASTYYIFRQEPSLNFNRERLITGINIIDDMLFWTDNFSEPKKINIKRGIAGTDISGNLHTDVIVENTNKGGHRERHITNIKRPPLSPPVLQMSNLKDRINPQTGDVLSTTTTDFYNWFGNLDANTPATHGLYTAGTTSVVANANGGTMAMFDQAAAFYPGDILLCTNKTEADPKTFTDHQVKLLVTGSAVDPNNPVPATQFEVEILHIDQSLTDQGQTWYIRLESGDPIYELKFPKFSYRYKYEDGEYSPFAPFSEIAFIPGEFEYHPKKGFNLGMVNNIRSLIIKDFVPKDIPRDVVEVDILYKESDSPNIYTVQTFNSTDPEWQAQGSGSNKGVFSIEGDLIHAVVRSNQFLRPWDNVPRRALAQEMTGNRIVYGNYVQNYNMKDVSDSLISPNFNIFTKSHDTTENKPYKSLKSLRTYQLGVVYKDVYGRETPVFSHNTSVINIDKKNATKSNKLFVSMNNNPPKWADSFKYFVKETSNEYYNLAMDRWYDAGDENIWLSFPSEDRNKVDDETTLILKKGDGNGGFVEETPRYKILAIKNEAPEYIKTTRVSMGYINMETSSGDDGKFRGSAGEGFPFVDRRNVKIGPAEWEASPLASLQNRQNTILEGGLTDKSTSLKFRILNGPPTKADSSGIAQATKTSKWYNVTNISASEANDGTVVPDNYTIGIEDPETGGGFGSDVLWATGSTDQSSGIISTSIWIEICKSKIESKPEFDGRFFVKILSDGSIKNNIKGTQISVDKNTNWAVESTFITNFLDGPDNQPMIYYDTGGPGTNATNPYGGADFKIQPLDLETHVFHPVGSGVAPQGATDTGLSSSGTVADYTERILEGNYLLSSGSSVNCANEPAQAGYIGVQSLELIPTSGPGGATHNSDFYGYILYWQNAEDGNNPNISYGSSWPATPPETHRYPGSKEGNGVDIDCYSQALLPLPYRPRTDWESLAFSGWFIDSEPLVYRFSQNGDDGSRSTVGDDMNARLHLIQTIGADVGQNIIDISFVGGFEPINDVGVPAPWSRGNWNIEDINDKNIADRLQTPGTIFRFANDSDEIAYEIQYCDVLNAWNYDTYGEDDSGTPNFPSTDNNFSSSEWEDFFDGKWLRRKVFRLTLVDPIDHITPKPIGTGADTVNNGYTNTSQAYSPIKQGLTGEASESTSIAIEFLDNTYGHQRSKIPTNPAIWETEPKEDVGLDIYYEASDTLPVVMNNKNDERYISIGSAVSGSNIPNDEPINIYKIFEEFEHYFNPTIHIEDADGISTSGKATASGQGIPELFTEKQQYGGWYERNWGANPGAGSVFKFGLYVYGDIATNQGIKYNQFLGIVSRVQQVSFKLEGPFNGKFGDASAVAGSTYSWTGVSNIPAGRIAIVPGSKLFFTNQVRVTGISGQTGIFEGSPVNVFGTELTLAGYGKCGWDGTNCTNPPLILANNTLTFTDADTSATSISLNDSVDFNINPNDDPLIIANHISGTGLSISSVAHGQQQSLSYFNCYSFGNGVESNRIKDLYNAVTIDKGVKASTTIAEQYKEETRGSGLIFSGIYNSKMKGVNRLNQFIQAESITKDLNPEYGSIQKLHQRDSDLITLCEDKILKILANKDALFNADGTKNLTATNRVLGQAQPFIGEYGISQNPESFASEAFRAYFTDKQRGAVLRLSRDGLTAISEHGMKDYFQDNLSLQDKIIGSYDTRKSLYNVSFDYDLLDQRTVGAFPSGLNYSTISFSEQSKGWVSFKSFQPETAISLNNQYYSTKFGELWRHHSDTSQLNSLYNTGANDGDGVFHPAGTKGLVDDQGDWQDLNSSITFVFNQNADTVKSFRTLNYEGSQARTIENTSGTPEMYGTANNSWDGQYYNNMGKDGWFVGLMETDQQTGTVKEFVKKESKWFSYIQGEATEYINENQHNLDTKEFSVQGIASKQLYDNGDNCEDTSARVIGCTDPIAVNYNSSATCNSCLRWQEVGGISMPTDPENYAAFSSGLWVDCCCYEEGEGYQQSKGWDEELMGIPIYPYGLPKCCPDGESWDRTTGSCV